MAFLRNNLVGEKEGHRAASFEYANHTWGTVVQYYVNIGEEAVQ
jgi:hypothetical protein